MEVQLFGEVSVYEPRGNYQIIVRSVQEKGVGALQAKFEALKRKLDAEGLFDPDAKKPIPRYPRTVCLVTSPTGAALQDMLNILDRRSPWLRVLLYPVRVQGNDAAGEIAAALRHLAKADNGLPPIDSVVVGRGGGSLEDMWPFNEEEVARAVHALPIPVVSAVGHEIDFTISDFAADLRAPTPSAAAELIAPDGDELHARLAGISNTLTNRVEGAIERWDERLEYLERGALKREPLRLLAEAEQEIDWKVEELSSALREAFAVREEELGELRHRLALSHPLRRLEAVSGEFERLGGRLLAAGDVALRDAAERVSNAAAALKNLGPDAVLSRGYSLTVGADGELVRSAADVTKGDRLTTKFSDGDVESVVE
jgi:exodeoxyribonuclease VII large subunit